MKAVRSSPTKPHPVLGPLPLIQLLMYLWSLFCRRREYRSGWRLDRIRAHVDLKQGEGLAGGRELLKAIRRSRFGRGHMSACEWLGMKISVNSKGL
jgi:hypothetical protein